MQENSGYIILQTDGER